jgi:hypothetical protein
MAQSLLLRYGVAMFSVGLALPLTLLLSPFGQGATPLFLAAVMVSAWYGVVRSRPQLLLATDLFTRHEFGG